MKQTRSLSDFSCLSEYTRLYPNVHWGDNRSVNISKYIGLAMHSSKPIKCCLFIDYRIRHIVLQGSFLGGKYVKDFQQHFLASFPYSLHDVPGKKTDIHDQVAKSAKS